MCVCRCGKGCVWYLWECTASVIRCVCGGNIFDNVQQVCVDVCVVGWGEGDIFNNVQQVFAGCGRVKAAMTHWALTICRYMCVCACVCVWWGGGRVASTYSRCMGVERYGRWPRLTCLWWPAVCIWMKMVRLTCLWWPAVGGTGVVCDQNPPVYDGRQ